MVSASQKKKAAQLARQQRESAAAAAAAEAAGPQATSSSAAEPEVSAPTAMPTCPRVEQPGTLGPRIRAKLVCLALALRRRGVLAGDKRMFDKTLLGVMQYLVEEYAFSISGGAHGPGMSVKDLTFMRLSRDGRTAVHTADGRSVVYVTPTLHPSNLPLRIVLTLSRDPGYNEPAASPSPLNLTVVFNNFTAQGICVVSPQCTCVGVYEYTIYVNGYRQSHAPATSAAKAEAAGMGQPSAFVPWPDNFRMPNGFRIELYTTQVGTAVELLGWGWGLGSAEPSSSSSSSAYATAMQQQQAPPPYAAVAAEGGASSGGSSPRGGNTHPGQANGLPNGAGGTGPRRGSTGSADAAAAGGAAAGAIPRIPGGKVRPKAKEVHPAKLGIYTLETDGEMKDPAQQKARDANTAKIGLMNADREAWWGAAGEMGRQGQPLPQQPTQLPRARGIEDSAAASLPAGGANVATGSTSPRTPPTSPPAASAGRYSFDSNEASCMGCGVRRDRSLLKQCPRCSKLDLPTYFCSQACFRAAWPKHKKVHQGPQGIFELMKHVEQRLQSFKTWPYNYAFANPKSLAESGYFFQPTLEYPDRCICYKCRGDIRNWCNKSIPWLLHKKFKKDCVLVREKFGGGVVHATDWRCKNKHCLYVNSGDHCCCAVCYKVRSEKEGHTTACPHKAKGGTTANGSVNSGVVSEMAKTANGGQEAAHAQQQQQQQVHLAHRQESPAVGKIHTTVVSTSASPLAAQRGGKAPAGNGSATGLAAGVTSAVPPRAEDVTLLRKGSRVILGSRAAVTNATPLVFRDNPDVYDEDYDTAALGQADNILYFSQTAQDKDGAIYHTHDHHLHDAGCPKHTQAPLPVQVVDGYQERVTVQFGPQTGSARQGKTKRRSKDNTTHDHPPPPYAKCVTGQCGWTVDAANECDCEAPVTRAHRRSPTAQDHRAGVVVTDVGVGGSDDPYAVVEADAYECEADASSCIRLLVVDTKGREVTFKVPKTVPLSFLTEAYCKREKCERRSVRFLFDSSILNDSRTAEELRMEDDDVIDVMGSELPNDSHHWHLLPTSDIPILDETHQALPEGRRQDMFKERTTLLALWPSGEYVNKPQMVLTRKRCPVFFTQPITGRRLRITLQLPKPEAVYIPQIRVEARTEEHIREVFKTLVSILQAVVDGKHPRVCADDPQYKALTSEKGKFLASPINMLQSVGFHRYAGDATGTYVICGDELERELCRDFKVALEDELVVLRRTYNGCSGQDLLPDKPSFQSKLRVYAATVLEEVGALKEALEQEAPNILLLSRCKQAWASAAVYWYFEHYSILKSSHRNLATQIFDAATQLLCAVYDFLNPQTEDERYSRFDDESSTCSSSVSSLKSPIPCQLAPQLLTVPTRAPQSDVAYPNSLYAAAGGAGVGGTMGAPSLRLSVTGLAPSPGTLPGPVPLYADPAASAAAGHTVVQAGEAVDPDWELPVTEPEDAELPLAYAHPVPVPAAVLPAQRMGYPHGLYGASPGGGGGRGAAGDLLFDPVSGLAVPVAIGDPEVGPQPLCLGDLTAAGDSKQPPRACRSSSNTSNPDPAAQPRAWGYCIVPPITATNLLPTNPRQTPAQWAAANAHVATGAHGSASIDERYYACSYLTQYYSLNASCGGGAAGAEEREDAAGGGPLQEVGGQDGCGGAGGGDHYAPNHDVSHSALSSYHSSGIAGGGGEEALQLTGVGGGDQLGGGYLLSAVRPVGRDAADPFLFDQNDPHMLHYAPPTLDLDALYNRGTTATTTSADSSRTRIPCIGPKWAGGICPFAAEVDAPEGTTTSSPPAPLGYPHGMYAAVRSTAEPAPVCNACAAVVAQYPSTLYAKTAAGVANLWSFVQIVRGNGEFLRACSGMMGDVLYHSDDEIETDSDEFTVAGSDSCLRELSDTDVDIETVSVTDSFRAHQVVSVYDANTTIPSALAVVSAAAVGCGVAKRVQQRHTLQATPYLAVAAALAARCAAVKTLHARLVVGEAEGRVAIDAAEAEGRAGIHTSIRSLERAYQKRLRDEKKQRAVAVAEEERSRGAIENEERNRRQQLTQSFEQVLAKRKAALEAWTKKWTAIQPEEAKARATIVAAEAKASSRMLQDMESAGRRCVTTAQQKAWQRLQPQLKVLGKILKQSHRLFQLETPARGSIRQEEHATFNALGAAAVCGVEAVARDVVRADERTQRDALRADEDAACAAATKRIKERMAREAREEEARRQAAKEAKAAAEEARRQQKEEKLQAAAAAAAAAAEAAAAEAKSASPTSASPVSLGGIQLSVASPVGAPTPAEAGAGEHVRQATPTSASMLSTAAASPEDSSPEARGQEAGGEPSASAEAVGTLSREATAASASSFVFRTEAAAADAAGGLPQQSPSAVSQSQPSCSPAATPASGFPSDPGMPGDQAVGQGVSRDTPFSPADVLSLLNDDPPRVRSASTTPSGAGQAQPPLPRLAGDPAAEGGDFGAHAGGAGGGVSFSGLEFDLLRDPPAPAAAAAALADDDEPDIPLPALLKALSVRTREDSAPSRNDDREASPSHAAPASPPLWLAPGAAVKSAAPKETPLNDVFSPFTPFDSFQTLMAPRPVERDPARDDEVKRLTHQLESAQARIEKQQRQIDELIKRNDALMKHNDRLTDVMKQAQAHMGPFVRLQGGPPQGPGPAHAFGPGAQGGPGMPPFDGPVPQHFPMAYPPGIPYGGGLPLEPGFYQRDNFNT